MSSKVELYKKNRQFFTI